MKIVKNKDKALEFHGALEAAQAIVTFETNFTSLCNQYNIVIDEHPSFYVVEVLGTDGFSRGWIGD